MKAAIALLRRVASNPLDESFPRPPELIRLLNEDRLQKYNVAKPRRPKSMRNPDVEVMDLVDDSPPEREPRRKRGRERDVSHREPAGKRQRTRQKESLRGSSPSHFNIDFEQEEASLAPEYLKSMPDHGYVNGIFEATAWMYYPNRDTHKVEDAMKKKVVETQNSDDFLYTSLDLLTSPLRRPSPLDTWSAKDIAVFEASICSFGKDFYRMSQLLPYKTTNDCVKFYYFWKTSQHYKKWKQDPERKGARQKAANPPPPPKKEEKKEAPADPPAENAPEPEDAPVPTPPPEPADPKAAEEEKAGDPPKEADAAAAEGQQESAPAEEEAPPTAAAGGEKGQEDEPEVPNGKVETNEDKPEKPA